MKSGLKVSTRRNLLRRSGTLVAASLSAPLLSASGRVTDDAAKLPAKYVLEGSPVRMGSQQLRALETEMASIRKTVARLREIRLRNGDEPATSFRA